MVSLGELNTQQRRAVEQTEGPVMIIAGPGTGKTKTLTSRIAYLIKHKHISPQHILAITFTRKAAAEMKERIQQLLDETTQLPLTTTFHSLGYSVLSLWRENISIATEPQINNILTELKAKYQRPSVSLRELALRISLYKSSVDKSNNTMDESFKRLIIEYQNILNGEKLLDYDDLLLKTYKTLRSDANKRATLQNTYKYILVDEFQDTNILQYELLKLLLNSDKNVFVIGDPLQSIYSFRGAHSMICEKLKKDFSDCLEISLTDNYRSHTHIIQVSSTLFPDIPSLQPKTEKKGRVTLVRTMHEYSEADWIVNNICNKVGGIDLLQAGENLTAHSNDKNCRFSDFAVVYRTHQLSNTLEKRFFESGIPYQVIGGNAPYEQREVAFIISVLKHLHHNNEESLRAILQSKLIKDLDTLTTIFSHKNDKLSILIDQIIATFDLSKIIDTYEHKVRSVQQFKNTMLQFDSSPQSLAKAVEYIVYLEEHEFYDPSADKVTLLTIHAAKGLEFKHVYICGFEEGIIPLKNADDLGEEKRLLYVAMTRAKEELDLIYTKERFKKPATISSFSQLLNSPPLLHSDDEAIAIIEKKRKKWLDKKSQMKLF